MDMIKGFDPLGNERFRKNEALKYSGVWATVVLSVFLAVALSQPFLLFGLFSLMVLKNQDKEAIAAEEEKVIECLRRTANYNIEAAKRNASGEFHQPMALHAMLDTEFDPDFIATLSDHELKWMKDRYDEMIESYTETRLEVEKSRNKLRDFGSSEQRQLEAYFRGKNELGAGNDGDDFDWNTLEIEKNKDQA